MTDNLNIRNKIHASALLDRTLAYRFAVKYGALPFYIVRFLALPFLVLLAIIGGLLHGGRAFAEEFRDALKSVEYKNVFLKHRRNKELDEAIIEAQKVLANEVTYDR
jgi:hypothetical protein